MIKGLNMRRIDLLRKQKDCLPNGSLKNINAPTVSISNIGRSTQIQQEELEKALDYLGEN